MKQCITGIWKKNNPISFHVVKDQKYPILGNHIINGMKQSACCLSWWCWLLLVKVQIKQAKIQYEKIVLFSVLVLSVTFGLGIAGRSGVDGGKRNHFIPHHAGRNNVSWTPDYLGLPHSSQEVVVAAMGGRAQAWRTTCWRYPSACTRRRGTTHLPLLCIDT